MYDTCICCYRYEKRILLETKINDKRLKDKYFVMLSSTPGLIRYSPIPQKIRLRGEWEMFKYPLCTPQSYPVIGVKYLLKLTWNVIYHWKRQPYFFLANLYLKQGISSEYAKLTHLHRLTRPVISTNREFQNEKFLHTVGCEPETLRLRSERAKRWAIRAD